MADGSDRWMHWVLAHLHLGVALPTEAVPNKPAAQMYFADCF